MPQATTSRAKGQHAVALQALLRASRELGPDMEEDLVATYLAQHTPIEPRRSLALAVLAQQSLRARFVPAALLAANLGGTALVQHIVISSDPWNG